MRLQAFGGKAAACIRRRGGCKRRLYGGSAARQQPSPLTSNVWRAGEWLPAARSDGEVGERRGGDENAKASGYAVMSEGEVARMPRREGPEGVRRGGERSIERRCSGKSVAARRQKVQRRVQVLRPQKGGGDWRQNKCCRGGERVPLREGVAERVQQQGCSGWSETGGKNWVEKALGKGCGGEGVHIAGILLQNEIGPGGEAND